jgi:leader peptidase (prepilin peptidase)/N-methyltransferase
MAHVVFFGGLGMLAGALARWLLGRLRRGADVPPPWCELLVGVLWAASGYWWAAGWLETAWLPLLLGLGWLAVAAGAVDLLHCRLPDALTVPALPAALLLAVPLGGAAVLRAALGAAALGGGYLLVRLVAPAAFGAGDVKLAAPLGAAMAAASWPALLVGALLAAVLTLGVAMVQSGVGALAGARLEAPLGARFGPPPGVPAGRDGPADELARDVAGGLAGVPRGLLSVVPHGPAMLAAGWLVLAIACTHGPLPVA